MGPNWVLKSMAVTEESAGGNPKASTRLDPLMHRYLEDLVKTKLYGKNKSQVIQRLIENGIHKAIADNHIKVRDPENE